MDQATLTIIRQRIEERKLAFEHEVSSKRVSKPRSKTPPIDKAQFKEFKQALREGRIKIIDGKVIEVNTFSEE